MGHDTFGHIMGPLALAGGIGATALGQPELGLPLMASGFGSTVGDVAGGRTGRAMGAEFGGLAGLGAEGFAPGLGTGASNMLGTLGAKIPGVGNFLAGQGNVGAALASTPSLRGITPGMVSEVMPNANALTSGASGGDAMSKISPLIQAGQALGLGHGGQPPQQQPPQAPPPAMMPKGSTSSGMMPMPQANPPVPSPSGGAAGMFQQSPTLQLLRAMGMA